jgi:hypothetical protein
MSTIRMHQTTTATPEQFLDALVDFGPGRSTLFGNRADDYLKGLLTPTSRKAPVESGSGSTTTGPIPPEWS